MKRIKTNDKVEIIDKNSPHFGKKGTVIDITQQPPRKINLAGKVIRSGTLTKLLLKIEGNGNVEITNYPNSLESQIKILEE